MSSVPLSVLDQSPICSGRTAADAITETIQGTRCRSHELLARIWDH